MAAMIEVVDELYNVRNDLNESKNLAGKHPEKVKVMVKQLDGFYAETGSLKPKANENYNGRTVPQRDPHGRDAHRGRTDPAGQCHLTPTTTGRAWGAGGGGWPGRRWRTPP